ncbi:ABC transporter substrate-binding protein [Phyllobacterium myrsinacearum]|jgi:peptide/nickel transport system substrate-binding protein|uniref:Peptide ABC transporter substrate-binding protein n=1 Tax=Phyllobacterium myrsinacearum TaxID=28101 RepID=A0A2S9JPB8_9HYPH|nr:ABC transporter substrate-binding protein [Phyllobacterium myrsinacearum]PRD55034.1 peptide ABC transporter substrate-binding protein [Phyllobacterium myrsinacearum]PWV90413.1 peptide/nickel transport system substrate-binding protein [Phyllobacterium myrsinacearum]RZS79811.1 peptide/nickel transport system substrate-binding protein [Phyllobacterium myrsinacearum]RZV05393.1 peptide/nickel transport system substrate-binding protein [Phyllobacterium myrsinacearum]
MRKQIHASLLGIAFLMTVAQTNAADLVMAIKAGPASMDPHFTATAANADAVKHIFDTLIRSGNNLELEPSLALSWTALDPTTWEFKLRKDVKFHDGSDFTAEDVKFSIERIPSVTGPNPTTIFVRRVKAVEIIDPYTIRIKTDGPAPSLPNDFVRLFIVSHKAAASYSTRDTAAQGFNSGKATIGTGPYKFVSWAPTQDLVLQRFDGYWGGTEPWDRVIRKEIPNDAARVAQLKAGQVDIISKVPASDVPVLERDSSLAVVKNESIYVSYLEFDFRENSPQIVAKNGAKLDKNPLRDPRVREAIDAALDRETIVAYALEDLAIVPTQLVSSNIFGFNKALTAPKYDVKHAKELLKDAGYGDGFKITLSYANDRMPMELGPTVAQMLSMIGITVEVNGVPAAVYNPARTRGEYSLNMASWGTLTGESNYTLSSLVHSYDPDHGLGTYNVRGYSNPDMDKLIKSASDEMDTSTRRHLLEEANSLVASDRPELALATLLSAWAMKKDKVVLTPRADEDTLAMNIRPAK